ncbi:DUF841-domain-containing protein [Linderina pennispora]|uniref:DUF841-domain-containing protein n=1 Tax=Linderina pennispora TaxID=61395 RepID=A0A1Y1W0P2_9FUNG|nr:DUF841-domain-containing protein [Linderina pennispora]KAJ1955312.1 hypothetical protein EC988_001952 [Linderina pennispora]ORX67099.1 DUF841-domain-containing protein [Linderina pennispora]
MSDFAQLVILSFLTSAASEAISYFVVYRTERFQQLKQKLIANEAKLAEEQSATAGNSNKRQKRIENLEAGLKATRRDAQGLQIRNTLIVAVIQVVVIYQVNSMFGGRSVATLPFEPISVFRSLTHRGLPDDSPATDCSATFVFILGGLAFKAVLDRVLQLGMPKGNQLPKWVTNPEEIVGMK